jgi:DNA-binding response OmpR family regulator
LTHKRYVFVVSDDDHIQAEARFGFSAEIDVDGALDAREAWEKLLKRRPDVVVVEIRTGSAGGVGLVRDMSQTSLLHDVPVLMLLERAQDEWLARQAGATKTLAQPFDAATLATMALSLIEEN